jgi:sugar phosphate isomerase/epimerase
MATTDPRIGVQLRVLDDPPAENVRRAGAAGYDGVAFASDVEAADPDDVAAALSDAGLDVVGAYVALDRLRTELESTVAFYDALDCDRTVVPSLDGERFADADTVAATTRDPNAADRLAGRGLELCHHNHDHDHEFHGVDGRTALEALAADLQGMGIELDVGHLARAGLDPPTTWTGWPTSPSRAR